MALEIELKARITDIDALRSHLDGLGELEKRYRKEDVYYGRQSRPLFRLRTEGAQGLVTLKDKSILHGIEESRETEFHVDNPESFGLFVGALGFVEVVRKVKVGWRYRLDGITAELSKVERLGNYLELELLLPETSGPPEISNARGRLLDLLSKLGIPEDRLEPRPYTDLLMNGVQN